MYVINVNNKFAEYVNKYVYYNVIIGKFLLLLFVEKRRYECFLPTSSDFFMKLRDVLKKPSEGVVIDIFRYYNAVIDNIFIKANSNKYKLHI